KAAKKIVFTPREPLLLGSLLPNGAPEIGIAGGGPAANPPGPSVDPRGEPTNGSASSPAASAAPPATSPSASPSAKGCGSCVLGASGADAPAVLTSIAALAAWWRRRKRR